MKPIHFFWITFIFSLYWLLYLFSFLLMDIIIALLICVATMSIKEGIEKYVKFNFLSSFLSVILLLTLFVVPLFYGVNIFIKFISSLTQTNITEFLSVLKNQIYILKDYLSTIYPINAYTEDIIQSVDDFFNEIDIASVVQTSLAMSTTIGKWSATFIKDTAFISTFVFIFYYYGRSMYRYTIKLLPIPQKESEGICAEVSGVLGVVVYSLIVSVIFQGTLFGVAVYFFDYNAVLFGILYGLASLVPVVGGTLVWIPVVSYEVYLGNYKVAIFIALYSMIIIATIADNVIKPIIIGFINRIVLKSNIKINELTIFFAIFAGLVTFGFWGMILGPTITALFMALVRLYENYFLPQQKFENSC